MSEFRSALAPPHSLWKHSEFMKLWSAQTVSVFGDQFTALAIPLIAALLLRATPIQMGILGAIEASPLFFLSLFAGVWVDRLPRRPILITGDVGRGVVLMAIPASALMHAVSMALLFVVAMLVGVLSVFYYVSYQAILPALVDRQQLVEGNSKLEATRSLADLAGPGIAGVVIQYIPRRWLLRSMPCHFLFRAASPA
ncbi:MAG TPA: MFS transporter [Candidatus Acidoferrales bacterium]|jgi:MFS family permease|nr:MFS transporter [Candidatus Acidoferrales bacterium]